jgi:hypothetical protein
VLVPSAFETNERRAPQRYLMEGFLPRSCCLPLDVE